MKLLRKRLRQFSVEDVHRLIRLIDRIRRIRHRKSFEVNGFSFSFKSQEISAKSFHSI